jgi:hypothetical protein
MVLKIIEDVSMLVGRRPISKYTAKEWSKSMKSMKKAQGSCPTSTLYR